MNYLDLDGLGYNSEDYGFFEDHSPSNHSNNMSTPEHMSSSSSVMSPASTSSETDCYTASPRTTTTEPYLLITEQPVENFRFRYQSEMHGTHGQLLGRKKPNQKKTFPTVELKNFNGNAEIVCLLYQANLDKPSSVHSHKLVVKQNDREISDPHVMPVSPQNGYAAVFQGMGIIHTVQKHSADELLRKKTEEYEYGTNRKATDDVIRQFRTEANREAKSINLNQVALCFKAYSTGDDGRREICPPVFSTSINNMKSAMTGDLRICRFSIDHGSMAGNEPLFLFVEKVCKGNIMVKFYESDSAGQEIWSANGIFTEADVHHQYAIALRTPEYTGPNRNQDVNVSIILVRRNDQKTSRPINFTYKSTQMRKRARPEDFEMPDNIPVPIAENVPCTSTAPIASPSIDMTLTESDIESVLEWLKYIPTDSNNDTMAMDALTNGREKSDRVPYVTQISAELKAINGKNMRKTVKRIEQIFMDSHNSGDNIIHTAIATGRMSLFQTLTNIVGKLNLCHILNLLNNDNENCLHIACANNKPKCVAKLLDYGCDMNGLNVDGFAPLHIATDENFIEVLDVLLDPSNTKLNLNIANSSGQTALHIAVRNDNQKITERLIDAGADTSLTEAKTGKNILHIAVEEKSIEMVNFVLNKFGTLLVNQKTSDGLSPLQLAENKKSNKKVDAIITALSEYAKNNAPIIKTADHVKVEPNSESKWNFDDNCMDTLCVLFKEQKAWKQLAKHLEYDKLISLWETDEQNASRMLLNYYELNEDNLNKLANAFTLMDQTEALDIIDKMAQRPKKMAEKSRR